MVNKWMAHVKKTMKHMSSKKKSMGKSWFKHVLKSAKSSYHKKGGDKSEKPGEPEELVSPAPTDAEKAETGSAASLAEGGRRKTRKHRRHRRRHH